MDRPLEAPAEPGQHQAPTPVILRRSEHCISRKNIDPEALKVMVRLHRHGFKSFLVGGSVRDLLVNRKPKDFDVGTDAHPGQIKKLFHNSRVIGRRFRLVHVFFRGNKTIEVSTFRRAPLEGTGQSSAAETGDDKKGDNTFGEPHEDALRRDLTINGLFYDISDFSVIDYVGGVEDLKAGIIRTIGDPSLRFREDPLRMIRAVRHMVRMGFRMESETYAAILRHAALLEGSNTSRLQDEFQKDFESGSFTRVLQCQLETGLLDAYFPELHQVLTRSPLAAEPTLLEPRWVWAALQRLDKTDEDIPVRRFRFASLLFPLLAARLQERYGVLSQAPRAPGEVHQLMALCSAPLGVGRKDREGLEAIWGGWVRLMGFLGSGRIPERFQRKPYYAEVLQWHRFYTSIIGGPPEEIENQLLQASAAGLGLRVRRRRKRRKNKGLHSKPPDFS